MAERKVHFAIHEFYYLYNRGVEKKIIFRDKADYKQFEYLLYICNTDKSIVLRDIPKVFERGEAIVEIGVYCLMPNHFHLLVHEKIEGGLSQYMRKLLTAYSMYFNKKYKRTGKLWQGVFQARHVDSDRYLKYLYAYIHLNPAKLIDPEWKTQGIKSKEELLGYVSSYQYSSMLTFLGKTQGRIKNIIINKSFPKYFNSGVNHSKELFEWLSYTDEKYP